MEGTPGTLLPASSASGAPGSLGGKESGQQAAFKLLFQEAPALLPLYSRPVCLASFELFWAPCGFLITRTGLLGKVFWKTWGAVSPPFTDPDAVGGAPLRPRPNPEGPAPRQAPPINDEPHPLRAQPGTGRSPFTGHTYLWQARSLQAPPIRVPSAVHLLPTGLTHRALSTLQFCPLHWPALL